MRKYPALFFVTACVYYTNLNAAPSQFVDVQATVATNEIKVKWTVDSKDELDHLEVQKSVNGIRFYTLGEVAAIDSATGIQDYFITDTDPNVGVNYYQVIAVTKTGEISSSHIIRVNFGRIDNSLIIYPNPTGSRVLIKMIAIPKGKYALNIYNNAGQRISSLTITHDGMEKILTVALPVTLGFGVYRIFMSNEREFYKHSIVR